MQYFTVLCIRRIFYLFIFISILGQVVYAQDIVEKNLEVIDNFEELSPDDLKLFELRAAEKIKEFENYIEIIGNKQKDVETRDYAIQSAEILFIPDSKMEVSSANTGTINSYAIGKYLRKLKSLGYTQVIIKFYKTAYISGLRKGVDNKYYATATVFQEFIGYNEDQVAYKDKTKKVIDIVLEYIDDEYYGLKRWELMLGDIKVVETRM
ncbi:MAG: hypothetical protein KQI35_14265 [Bacteroidetes bacterium]|nr:hypothetical protein [Bacteroidota bacterium]